MFRHFTTKISGNVQTARLTSLRTKNEPILEYKKGSKERKELETTLDRMSNECPDICVMVGKQKIMTKDTEMQKMPHCHSKNIAKYSIAPQDLIQQAIYECMITQECWRSVPLKDKCEIWNNAADLMACKYRQELNAAIMLGQAKTVIEAEIDTVELIDFLRFGAEFAMQLSEFKPLSPLKASYNTFHLRPLDGFVAAITPFNFAAIGGNLSFTPAILGNCIVWKPSPTSILANWISYNIMLEAGVPHGVVNFVPSIPDVFGKTITCDPNLACISFTGSVATFQKLWMKVSENLTTYNCFPRLIGECGGKNYHFVHPSANLESVVYNTIRSAFEYSGQKCSACSRIYIPKSMCDNFVNKMKSIMSELKVGDVRDFKTFTSAVIDSASFKRLETAIKSAKKTTKTRIVAGGKTNKTTGYFVDPTMILVEDACHPFMTDELFGPVLSVYVYKDNDVRDALELVNDSKYALTGAIFSEDKDFVKEAVETLRMSAGNFYINDKCTGSVVAQQPFGGSRLSGTNDKAGSASFLMRFASPQIIKETFVPSAGYKYPHMS